MVRLSRLRFENFKALRDCVLNLGRFNLLIGPNGSGKSTVIQALRLLKDLGGLAQPNRHLSSLAYSEIISAGAPNGALIALQAEFVCEDKVGTPPLVARWECGSGKGWSGRVEKHSDIAKAVNQSIQSWRFFSFDPAKIQEPNSVVPAPSLDEQGKNLASVLHWLRDESPDRFAAIQEQLRCWLPEFSAVHFKTVAQGVISVQLRMADWDRTIPAGQLSHGTLISLALLTLAYLPDPPQLVCLEEPDRGLHPRLMRQVRDAVYRLAYPESFGDKRAPVQVIATTHSPYFLDQFSEHPEEVIICEKKKHGVTFHSLAEDKELLQTIKEKALGESWYTGLLGGVPSES